MIPMEELQYLFPELEENYKYLHQHPELGFEEVETSKFVLAKLAEYGIEGKQIAHTGVIATIQGGQPGKTVGIRADMDALPIDEQCDVPYRSQVPGKMHACGHDAHTSMLLAAAKYLNEHKDQLKGNVRLIFEPAEEGCAPEAQAKAVAAGGSPEPGGSASMIACGALDGVDACFALHVMSALPKGTFGIMRDRTCASSDVFNLTIQGRGGHSSAPHLSIDPTSALAAIINAYNAFPARELPALDPCTMAIGVIKCGEVWNAIPDSAFVSGGVRAFSEENREFVFKRLEEIANDICKSYRCTANFSRLKGYSPTVNTPEISMEMLDVAKKLFGEDKAQLVEEPQFGSESAGRYFTVVPGAIGWLGSAPDEGPVNQHNPSFKISLDSMHYGVLFHVNMVQDYLNK